jgi:hypothetical protein
MVCLARRAPTPKPDSLNWLIWLAFFAELVTMLALAPDRARYLLLNPIDLAIVVLTLQD